MWFLFGGSGLGSVSKRNANMKKLLTALVAVGFVVGCGGDSTGVKASTEKTTKVSTPDGTNKTTEKVTTEKSTTTDKDKK
jgi:hypothetical protein